MIHLFSLSVFGQAIPKYGPEFTFLISFDPAYFPYNEASDLRNLIAQVCTDCTVLDSPDPSRRAFKVSMKGHQFTFKVAADPSVAEVTATAQSAAVWDELKDFFQKNVFNVIQSKNFNPDSWRGAGHINISLDSFDSAEHMQKFIVLMTQHSEVSFVFGESFYDDLYAKLLHNMSSAVKKDFQKRIVGWRSNPALSDRDNRLLLLKTLSSVYEQRLDLKKFKPQGYSIDSEEARRKYVMLAPREYADPERARLEYRAVRPQQNMDEWIKELKFLDRFIAYSKTASIDFDPNESLDLTAAKNLKKFAELLLKLNLNLDDYDFMIKKSWRKSWAALKANSGGAQCRYLF